MLPRFFFHSMKLLFLKYDNRHHITDIDFYREKLYYYKVLWLTTA